MEIGEKAERLAKAVRDKFAELLGIEDRLEKYPVQAIRTGDAADLMAAALEKHEGKKQKLTDNQKELLRRRFDEAKWPYVLQCEVGDAPDNPVVDDFE